MAVRLSKAGAVPTPSTNPNELTSHRARLASERECSLRRQAIDNRLDELAPAESTEPQSLHRSVRYSVLGAGKRVRPILTLTTAAAFAGDEDAALDPACAIEMVHTASLILDDLPCMDNASFRRGKAANHRVFGEATATLAAIYLLNRAYGVIAEAPALRPETRNAIGALLSRSIGTDGLVAGQCLDLTSEGVPDLECVKSVEELKTATLFVAAAETGALVAGLSERELESVRLFGWNLGLAFQLRDDWIDAASSPEQAGKDVGQDANKTTLVSLLGVARARDMLDELIDQSIRALAPLGPAGESLGLACRQILSPIPGDRRL